MKQKNSTRKLRRARIKKHIQKTVLGTPERPRLAVYRSLREIYAQVIDDTSSRTLLSMSSKSKPLKDAVKQAKDNKEVAHLVGKALGEEAKKLKIEKVVFDRSGYLYHGRVKALAEGAREAGLKF